MKRSEVLQKIKEATEAIQEYKEGNVERVFGESVENSNSNIETASLELIAEAKTIGASGSACPRCGGSGRA